ncbi:MAG: SLAP domain-containing protein [Treponema sp.]|uniref:SLAP domain-containing protein n=1 Tax=Treponema sp. TaxID=166 RepID=UPI0025F5C65D|nr:SLAP domain-containing protein [Treponema sp.]MBR0494680.1 SLAP domain-containing protein [Treponema sp.]
MKKRISRCEVIASCVLVLLAGVMIPSCKEKAPAAASGNPTADNAGTTVSKERTLRNEIVLYFDKDGNNTPLYAENKEGKMVWADEAIPGDEIEVYESLENASEPEVKNAIRSYTGGKEESMDFVHVRYYGKDYWTRPIFITGHSKKNWHLTGMVITEDTYIYSSTDLVNAKTKKVEKGTFVAKYDSETIDGIKFFQIYYYDWSTPYGKEGYVKAETCSDSDIALQAAQVERAFSNTKDLKPFVREDVYALLEDMKEI